MLFWLKKQDIFTEMSLLLVHEISLTMMALKTFIHLEIETITEINMRKMNNLQSNHTQHKITSTIEIKV